MSPFLELMSFEAQSKVPYLASDAALLAVNQASKAAYLAAYSAFNLFIYVSYSFAILAKSAISAAFYAYTKA